MLRVPLDRQADRDLDRVPKRVPCTARRGLIGAGGTPPSRPGGRSKPAAGGFAISVRGAQSNKDGLSHESAGRAGVIEGSSISAVPDPSPRSASSRTAAAPARPPPHVSRSAPVMASTPLKEAARRHAIGSGRSVGRFAHLLFLGGRALDFVRRSHRRRPGGYPRGRQVWTFPLLLVPDGPGAGREGVSSPDTA